MAIEINGVVYRNLEQQVTKNVNDIADLKKSVEDLPDSTYSKTQIDNKDAAVLTEAEGYTYSKTQIDNKDADTLTVALGAAKDYTDAQIAAGGFLKANDRNKTVDIMTTDGTMPFSELNLTNPSDVQTNARIYALGNSGYSASLSAMAQPNAGTIQLGTVNNNKATKLYLFDAANSYYENANNGGIKIRFPYNLTQTPIDTTFATLKDLPAAVSGTNDGTNWTTLTIGSDTYGLASGSGSSTMYTHTLSITKANATSSNTDLKVIVQFNNFNNTQITSYSAIMTAFANHSIPEILIGTGWAKSSTITGVCLFDKATIQPNSNKVEFRFTNQSETWTPLVFYLEETSSTYTITDTVTPISA